MGSITQGMGQMNLGKCVASTSECESDVNIDIKTKTPHLPHTQ